jgi:hypothetical protein
MSISAISGSLQSVQTPATKSKADETIEQLAQEGDPVAIAELQAQEEQDNPAQQTASAQTGATEPGKGQQVDQYV